jgi:hypothetical protein
MLSATAYFSVTPEVCLGNRRLTEFAWLLLSLNADRCANRRGAA